MGLIYKLVFKLLNILQLLYLIRFPLLILLFLAFFRCLIFDLGVGKDYLMGLFDVPGFWNVFWLAFFSFTLSWTAVTLMKVTLIYGEERFHWGEEVNLKFIRARLFHQIVFLVSCLCPVVLFTGIFWLEGNKFWLQVGGAISGAAAAFAVLILVDLLQLFFSDFQDKGETPDVENMLIPFPNPLYKAAAEYPRQRRKFEIRAEKRLEKILKKIPPEYGKGYIEREKGRARIYPGHIFSALMFLVFLFIYVAGFLFWYYSYTPSALDLGSFNFGVTSFSYVLILLTLLCSVFSGIAFLFDRFRIPTLLVVAFILYFANLKHTYDVRPLEVNNSLTPAEIFEKRRDRPYIIVVATNGGGIQAAAWTTQVLSGLIKECKRLDTGDKGCENAIALISSVSGGSVGTMFFVNGYDGNGKLSAERMDQIVELSKASSLDYVAGGLVYADFVRNLRVFNIIDFEDRGSALERSWRDNTKEIFKSDPDAVNNLEGYFSTWREDARAGKRPAVIFNSTTVETGGRFIFSTTDISRPEDGSPQSLPCDNGHKILFRGWDSFYRVFPQKDIKITAAARLSASFPFVSPTANMKGGDRETLEGRHFVDGGYHENYGIASLLDWLDEGLCLSPAKPPKILIIQIVADHVFEEKQGANLSGSWFGQTLTPAETLLGVRGTVQLARNETELKLFLRYWRETKGIEIEKVVFQYVPKKSDSDNAQEGANKENGSIKDKGESELAPLSWHLTPGQKANVEKVWKRACDPGDSNKEALDAFRHFIDPGVQSEPVCQ